MSEAAYVTSSREVQLTPFGVSLSESQIRCAIYTHVFPDSAADSLGVAEVQEIVAQLFDALEEKRLEEATPDYLGSAESAIEDLHKKVALLEEQAKQLQTVNRTLNTELLLSQANLKSLEAYRNIILSVNKDLRKERDDLREAQTEQAPKMNINMGQGSLFIDLEKIGEVTSFKLTASGTEPLTAAPNPEGWDFTGVTGTRKESLPGSFTLGASGPALYQAPPSGHHSYGILGEYCECDACKVDTRTNPVGHPVRNANLVPGLDYTVTTTEGFVPLKKAA